MALDDANILRQMLVAKNKPTKHQVRILTRSDQDIFTGSLTDHVTPGGKMENQQLGQHPDGWASLRAIHFNNLKTLDDFRGGGSYP